MSVEPGPFRKTQSAVDRYVIGGTRLAIGWLWVSVSFTAVTLFALITFRRGTFAYVDKVAHLLGWALLRLSRIKLDVRGIEHIQGRKARIVALNHSSLLDHLIVAALLPPATVPIVKRETIWIPFLGGAFWAFNSFFIDRSNVESAKQTLADAGRRMVAEQISVIISPEGTRSRDGKLGPFKMGAFHLAKETRAPIVPMIVRGAAQCQPLGTFLANPGIVQVEFLPEVGSEDWTDANLRDKRDALRDLFLSKLT